MRNNSEVGRGPLIARVLTDWWTTRPASLLVSAEDLQEVAPFLLNSGAGAMGWWRVRHSSLRATPVGEQLHQAYRLHTLEAAVKQLEIADLFSFLRSQDIEPLMGKGWAIARYYPEPGLRPHGDIDLYVRPEQFDLVVAALERPGSPGSVVDLHRGVAELADRSYDELHAHSQVLRVGSADVRVFGPEDHLRLLALHMLREGVLRPLWLCDIAVALKSRPPDFDWNYFLSGDERRTDWVTCAIGLAHHILGAEVSGLPVADRARHLPSWMVPVVLQQWGTGRVTNGRRQPMQGYLRHPAGLLDALRLRWPNPIEATVNVRGPMNEWPRFPFQVFDCLRRTAGFARQVPRMLREAS